MTTSPTTPANAASGVTTIFGTGKMGSAIAGLLEQAGRAVQSLDASSPATDVDGDIVILAVPFEAVTVIVQSYGEQLQGRIVVDLTNPVDFETFDALKVPADSSAAAVLQSTLPDARVVKAFNTNFADTLSSKQVGPNHTTVLVASDDEDAKRALLQRIQEIGLAGIDAGSMLRARELEALGFLQITLANREKISWSAGFGIVDE